MNEKREVIIPGVCGVLRFLADGVNNILDENDIVGTMQVIAKRYTIAKGRIQGIPLEDLIKNTDMEIEEHKPSVEEQKDTIKVSRLYDELGLNKQTL